MSAARFLLDRSLGQRTLVSALRREGWDAVTLAERFGDARAQQMLDTEWIAEGTTAGFVLLAKDHRLASRPLEATAIYLNDARVVTFARGDATANQMIELCLRHTARIHRLATVAPPFVFSITGHGLTRKHLNVSLG